MTTLSRSASLLAARTSLAFVVLNFALLGAWTAGDLLGQAPDQKKQRVEEEEETPKAKAPQGQKKRVEKEEEAPQKRKVIRVDEENPKTKPETSRSTAPAAGGDLAQLAKQATHPALKELFNSLAVPHDHVVYQPSRVLKSGERRRDEENIVPTPLYLGDDPVRYRDERLRFTLLTPDWQQGKSFEPLIDNIASVRPYEEIAQGKVKNFLHENF